MFNNITSNAIDYTSVCTHAIDSIFETDFEDETYTLPQTWSELILLLIRHGLVLIRVGKTSQGLTRFCFASYGTGFVHKGACDWEDETESDEDDNLIS